MSKERLKYIDVTKGILIIIVVLCHIPSHAKLGGAESFVLTFIGHQDYWFLPFFMPGFFVITGFCASHDKNFKQHIWANVRTTLLPAFTLCFFSKLLISIIHFDSSVFTFFNPKLWIAFPTGLWFFSSLFLAKEIYWIVNKSFEKWSVKFVVLFILTVFGVAAGKYGKIIPNFWYWKQAMTFGIFLMIGHWMRMVDFRRWYWLGLGFMYPLSIMFLRFVLHYDIPGVGYNFRLDIYDIPIFILLAVMGTVFVMNIAISVRNSVVLSFFGFWSGFVYALHFDLLDHVAIPFLSNVLYPSSVFRGLMFYILSALITLGICSLFIRALDKKYTRYFLGKI